MKSNTFLWVLQLVMGLFFIGVGILHFAVPEGLPDRMAYMYDMSDGLHVASGSAEILGGLGLLLPGLTKIRTELTVYAALGLVVVMIAAAIWHLNRGETSNIVSNVILAGILAWIAAARLRFTPLPSRSG